jgi:hypothetical protein
MANINNNTPNENADLEISTDSATEENITNTPPTNEPNGDNQSDLLRSVESETLENNETESKEEEQSFY